MATERTLNIELKAKDLFSRVTTKLDRTMGASGRVMKKAFDLGKRAARAMRTGVNAVGRAIKVMLGPLTLFTSALTLISGGGLLALVKTAANAGDNLQKLSERLALSVEFLSEMQFVAARTGVKVEALGIGIQRVTRRMSEFRETGAGAGAAGFNLLGEEVRDAVAAGESFEELLPKLARGFEGLESQQDKVRAAFSLFDSEGVSFIQFLQLGAKGIEELRDRARELGGVIKDEDAVAAATFNDALEDLVTSLKGVRNVIGAGLFGILTEKLKESAQWIAKNRDLLAGYISAGGRLGIRIFSRLFDFLRTKLTSYQDDWTLIFTDIKAGFTLAVDFAVAYFTAGAETIGVIFTTLANRLPRVIQAAFKGFSFTDALTTGDPFSGAKSKLLREVELAASVVKGTKKEIASLDAFFASDASKPANSFQADGIRRLEAELDRLKLALPRLENDLQTTLSNAGLIGANQIKKELREAISETGEDFTVIAEEFGSKLKGAVSQFGKSTGSTGLLTGIRDDFRVFQRELRSVGGGKGPLFDFGGKGPFDSLFGSSDNGPFILVEATEELKKINKETEDLAKNIKVVGDEIDATFGEAFARQSEQIRDDFSSMPALGRDTATSLFNALDQNFFSAMRGELTSIKDFFLSTFRSIALALQQMLSSALAGQIVGGLGSLFSGGSLPGTSNFLGSTGFNGGGQPFVVDGPFGGPLQSIPQSGSFSSGQQGQAPIIIQIKGEVIDSEFWEKNGDKIGRSLASAAGRNNATRANLRTAITP